MTAIILITIIAILLIMAALNLYMALTLESQIERARKKGREAALQMVRDIEARNNR